MKQAKNIINCLEELEGFIDDFADCMAYKEQAKQSREMLKLAIEELEELLK